MSDNDYNTTSENDQKESAIATSKTTYIVKQEKHTPKKIEILVQQALAIQDTNAKEADAIGYTSPLLILATMPHSEPKDENGNKMLEFTRSNGPYSLTMQGDPELGVPYGSLARLIFVFIISEAVRTQNKEVFLGRNLSEFMREIGFNPIWGKRGNIRNVREQLARFSGCRITCKGYKIGKGSKQRMDVENLESLYQISPVSKAMLWWNPTYANIKNSTEPLFKSSIILTDEFYNQITSTPVPLDMRALKALKNSSMALDIYSWLTYSMFSLRSDVKIPWKKLFSQFGANYKRLVDFKKNFMKELKDVLLIYKNVNITIEKDGVSLQPSPTHVKPEFPNRESESPFLV